MDGLLNDGSQSGPSPNFAYSPHSQGAEEMDVLKKARTVAAARGWQPESRNTHGETSEISERKESTAEHPSHHSLVSPDTTPWWVGNWITRAGVRLVVVYIPAAVHAFGQSINVVQREDETAQAYIERLRATAIERSTT